LNPDWLNATQAAALAVTNRTPYNVLGKADTIWKESHGSKLFDESYMSQSPSTWANQRLGLVTVTHLANHINTSLTKIKWANIRLEFFGGDLWDYNQQFMLWMSTDWHNLLMDFWHPVNRLQLRLVKRLLVLLPVYLTSFTTQSNTSFLSKTFASISKHFIMCPSCILWLKKQSHEAVLWNNSCRKSTRC
jgi:hypothetical protein